MQYKNENVAQVAQKLKSRLADLENKRDILRAPELRELFSQISKMPGEQRANFGEDVNKLRTELEMLVKEATSNDKPPEPIDLTAPLDVNQPLDKRPRLLSSELGSQHPLMKELDDVLDIFNRMGFSAFESRQIDDEYHMFTSLNFPEGHPARDEYDTFTTTEGLIAPAHVSVMQNRLLKKFKENLEKEKPIACVYAGRTFRNEDLDARHEHTFYQVEIIYVDKKINAGNLLATFKTFLEEYYQQSLEIKTQPFYFPFTEPSFELALSCPFCQKKGCNVCSYNGWIELLGMGMVNPNVLKMAGIDPEVYTGFAGGMGFDRLVMMKYDIEDVRHFKFAKLDFLRQFE